MDEFADRQQGGSEGTEAWDDVQQVRAERMEDGGTPFGGGYASAEAGIVNQKPPVLAAWICLVIAWLFLGSRIPFTVLLGIPMNVAALVLSLLCLGRNALFSGFGVLVLGTIGSLVVYIIGIFRFLTAFL